MATGDEKSCGSEGAFSRFVVTPVGAALDATAESYDFIREDLRLREWITGVNSLTGMLDLSAAHRRTGMRLVVGRVLLNISPKELENWLPRMIRGTSTVNAGVNSVHEPGNQCPEFDVWMHRENATFKYTNCQVASWTLSGDGRVGGSDPQLVRLLLTFIGMDEVDATAEWAAAEAADTLPPKPSQDVLFWLHGDAILRFDDEIASPGGNAYATAGVIDDAPWPFEAFNLTMDHNLQPKFRNSITPICIRSQRRTVRFQPRIPLSAASAEQLHFNRVDCKCDLEFTSATNLGNNDSQTLIEFGRLFGTKNSPSTAGRVETFLDLDLTAYPGDTLPVVRVTNTFPGFP